MRVYYAFLRKRNFQLVQISFFLVNVCTYIGYTLREEGGSNSKFLQFPALTLK